jgi:hypothetical protein
MKYLLVSAALLLSLESMANTVAFECQPSANYPLNRFTATGTVETKSNGELVGQMAARLVRVGADAGVTNTGILDAAGTEQIFPAGQFGVDEVKVFTITSSIGSAHILLGLQGGSHSTMLVDGVQYNSECVEKN